MLGVSDVLSFDFFEPPAVDQLSEALLLLCSLGALDAHEGGVTRLGRDMARLPLDPRLSRR